MMDEVTVPRLGFIGLGDIGGPMAGRLLELGVPLMVHNRTVTKAASLRARGAIVADSPAQLATACDIVISCLQGPSADRAVFLGREGLLAGQIDDTLFI